MYKVFFLTIIISFISISMMAQVEPGSPAYSDFSTLQKQLKSIEKYKLKENYSTMKTYLAFAKKTIKKINEKFPDLDISNEENQLERYQKTYDAANQPQDKDDYNYLRSLYYALNSVYSDTDHGADVADGLQFVSTHVNLTKSVEKFQDFSIVDFNRRVQQIKQNGNYDKLSSFIYKIQEVLDDYPRFINNSQSTYAEYLRWLNNIGVKGDPTQELVHLKATQTFCELLLKFAPNNTTATQWLKEVDNQISRISGGISYASSMHEKHMGEMLFSKNEVVIGSENENDFQKDFKSGDYIFATIYLPSKVRGLTDSYASNDVVYKINGSMIAEGSMTAVWVTTPMQEKNYLQFAIVPSPEWKAKNAGVYVENKLRTHEHIAKRLLDTGPYSGTTVEVILTFRGTHSKVKGSFTIDLSGGTDHLAKIIDGEENTRLSNQKLPTAGMVNADLEQQALNILRKSSGNSGKTYNKAIILSKNWDYDKAYTGVVVSRSVVIALVSKEHDGKCMYQYFNFKQQAQGNGSFNQNLEFAGAGENFYLSCENAK